VNVIAFYYMKGDYDYLLVSSNSYFNLIDQGLSNFL